MSDGMLTLDLIQEEDAPHDICESFRVDLDKSFSKLSSDCPRSKTDGALCVRTAEASGKSQSLPRDVAVIWEQTPAGSAPVTQSGKHMTTEEKNHCASMDEILLHSETRSTKNRMAASPCSPTAASSGTTAPISQLQELIGQKLEKTERLLMQVRGEVQLNGEHSGANGKDAAEGAQAEAERLLKEAAAVWSQAREVLEEVKELRALYRQLDPPTDAAAAALSLSNSSKQNPHRKSMM
ncbi:hypothetical protein LDENG_00198490 [Lucifuga dentata]|nr:hypothetical protein LDENG_00198490 [Lucifuga dentata]